MVENGNVFEGDFKSCFYTINHEFILNKIKGFPLHNLVDKFLKAGYVDNNIFIIQIKELLKEVYFHHY